MFREFKYVAAHLGVLKWYGLRWLCKWELCCIPATRGLYSPSSGPTGSWCLLPSSSSRASEVPPWLGWGLECAPECWLWPRLARLASISTTGAGARSPAPSSWTESGRGEILKGKLRTVPEVGQSLPSALSHQNVLSPSCPFDPLILPVLRA